MHLPLKVEQQLKVLKMKIKVKEFVKGLYTEAKNENGDLVPFINPKGDCIDLRAAEDYNFEAPQAGTLHQKNGIKTADVKLYMGDRHELFFEENSDTVIQELIDWIENIIQVSK